MRLAALAASLLLAMPAMATPELAPEVAPEVTPENPIYRPKRDVANTVFSVLLLPIAPFARLQSHLQPEKASCWNEGVNEVAGCALVPDFKGRDVAVD